MKLTKTKDLQICSIKRLYLELEENLPDRKTIAILISMENVEHPALKLLDNYHKVMASMDADSDDGIEEAMDSEKE